MMNKKFDLIITVIDIQGTCPVYKLDDKIIIRNGFILDGHGSGSICMHSLASILPYYIALSRGISPIQLGLNKEDESLAYLQCLDPCKYTGGGTVTFALEVCENER